MQRSAWWVLAAVVVTAAVFGLRLAQYVHLPRGEGVLEFRVEPGTGARELATVLAENGFARWRWGTRVGLRLWSTPPAMKAGSYALQAPLRLIDVYDAVVEGRVAQVTVTLPEGLTAREMATVLDTAGVVDRGEFLKVVYADDAARQRGLPGATLEGFLFPDTYRFAEGLPAERVVEVLVRRFKSVTRPRLPELENRGLSLLEWVTLASIVEKETAVEQERPLIAGVFANRLERKMRLESDPTVIYGIEEFDGNIRKRDLRADTPYNTYTRKGLPPGPIANPGLSSLEAALRPADVPYLFFVSRNDGTHQFSATYEEHRNAVQEFQLRMR